MRVEAELYPGCGHADVVAALSVPARHRAPVLDDAAQFIESVTTSVPAPPTVSGSAQLSGAR